MSYASVYRHPITPAYRGLLLAAAMLGTTSLALANNYDEVVSGDLSGIAAGPTDIGSLGSGINRISGTTIPTGTFDDDTHSYTMVDDDYVTFTVPTGYVLSDLQLASDSIIQSGDNLFLGIAQGAGVSVDPSFSSAAGLLGWTLVGSSMVSMGSNLLPYLGASAPADFPAIGGAAGFTGPLVSGQYTMWIRDANAPVAYDFRLDLVPAVPEPDSWLMIVVGIALMGVAVGRRVHRH